MTCPKASAKDIHVLFPRSPKPKQTAFSGAIWILDLDHRVHPLDKMEFARMRWASAQMVEKQSVNKVLAKVVVSAAISSQRGRLQKLAQGRA